MATLAAVGIEEKNARQAIARLSDQGLIYSERAGRRVRWQLTPEGRALLTEGTARIYGFLADPAEWDGRWLVVTFSVPEGQRASRHRLRQQLAFAGFGFPSAGVAVSTHLDREPVAVATLRRLGIDGGAMVFRGEAGSLAGDADLVRRAWDLDGLGRDYERFIDRFTALRPGSRHDMLAALTRLVHEWRRFPFEDPELPARLLPPDWPGRRARRLFDDRHCEWAEAARCWFAEADRL